jgi:uncharacterized protein (TIGR03435 family)
MQQLAEFAGNVLTQSSVIDRTGLTGWFDYISLNQATQDDFHDSFLRLIPEIGLKLTPSKGPIETLVIDHAEQPSPN